MIDGGATARRFHDRTAHSPYSVRTSGHTLDWDIKPFPFKIYADLEPILLPRDFGVVATDACVALAARETPRASWLDLGALAAVLYYSAGVTKQKTYPGGAEVLFRAAASTGALYQTEVYVAAGAVDGLEPGLYHFCPGDFALRRLRADDVRHALAQAAVANSIGRRAATIVLTAIYWRNTWKYQARGFRHLFWDSGTLLANLDATAHTLGLAPMTFTSFVDADVNRILGIDPTREGALELVALGPDTPPAAPAPIEPIAHRTVPLSSSEVDYPLLRETYEASSLASPAEVAAWRQRSAPVTGRPQGELRRLPAARAECGKSLGDTIQRRGSTREFSHEPISEVQLATALWYATRWPTIDVPDRLVDLYLIVNAVDNVAPGAYCYWPGEHALETIRTGAFRDHASWLTLEQALGGEAAATLFFLSPLDAVLAAYGDRGYRLVNLDAGWIGGRAYLAAYAQGFGASGLTFYDSDVVDFFRPHADGKDAIFVTALGRSRVAVRSDEARIPVTSRLWRSG
jgi:SagB-type dehydrogenase family enzyme